MNDGPSSGGISPRLPFVLLTLMTLVTFGGPVVIWIVLRGGSNPKWPPDRPIEWITFAIICGLVLGFMALCVTILIKNQREVERLKRESNR